jgi:ribosomal protein S10
MLKNNIKLNLHTIHYPIFLKFKYFIQQFCNIYKIKHTIKHLKKDYHPFSLLKSPHIHKYTWRKYQTININYIINFKSINFETYKKLKLLLKLLNNNSYLKLQYTKNKITNKQNYKNL